MTYKIAVDNGHGIETAGKRTPPLLADIVIGGKVVRRKGETIHEKEWNRPVADYLITALRRCGFDVVDCCPTDKDIPLADRYNKANTQKANLFVSKHFNAATGNWWTPGYTLTFTCMANTATYKESKTAAALVQAEIAKINGRKNNGVQDGKAYGVGNLAVLANTTMPAFLTEAGFMDVWEDAKTMLDPSAQQADAEATCRGICQYFKVNYVAATAEPPQWYRVQVGAFSSKENAEKQLASLVAAGFSDAYITK